MMDLVRVDQYLVLLNIRRAAAHRNTLIQGSVFLVLLLAMTALGMLDRITGRAAYLEAALMVCFGFGFLMSWVKLEVIRGNIETIENLKRIG